MQSNQRNVVLQLASLVTLYISISFTLVIIFAVINKLIPSPVEANWESEQASQSIRLGLAMVLVFFPTYLYVTRKVQFYRREKTEMLYQEVTKWLIYLSLLVGGLVLLGTLVTVLYNFLNGDLTFRFLLKAGSMAIILTLACFYYVKDAQGYWVKNEGKSLFFGGIASAIVLVTVVLGIYLNDSPQTVRELKLDNQQLNDLRQIQWAIQDYLHTNGTTTAPSSLDDLSYYMTVPAAPTGRSAYTYEPTETGFTICATFFGNNTEPYSPRFMPVSESPTISSENWDYRAGEHCFNRQIIVPKAEWLEK